MWTLLKREYWIERSPPPYLNYCCLSSSSGAFMPIKLPPINSLCVQIQKHLHPRETPSWNLDPPLQLIELSLGPQLILFWWIVFFLYNSINAFLFVSPGFSLHDAIYKLYGAPRKVLMQIMSIQTNLIPHLQFLVRSAKHPHFSPYHMSKLPTSPHSLPTRT